jgi:hypothetical protein
MHFYANKHLELMLDMSEIHNHVKHKDILKFSVLSLPADPEANPPALISPEK